MAKPLLCVSRRAVKSLLFTSAEADVASTLEQTSETPPTETVRYGGEVLPGRRGTC
jgi:hypothetical protein